MRKDVVKTLSIGRPGMKVSAVIDVYEENIFVDVGAAIKKELEELNPQQEGYREDAEKYAAQVDRYNKGE